MRTFASLLLVLLPGLGGCGAELPGSPSVTDLADKLACEEMIVDDLPDAGSDESGQCTIDESPVYLYAFRSSNAASSFVETSKMWEDSDPHLYPHGDRWVVQVSSDEVAAAVAETLGGDLP